MSLVAQISGYDHFSFQQEFLMDSLYYFMLRSVFFRFESLCGGYKVRRGVDGLDVSTAGSIAPIVSAVHLLHGSNALLSLLPSDDFTIEIHAKKCQQSIFGFS